MKVLCIPWHGSKNKQNREEVMPVSLNEKGGLQQSREDYEYTACLLSTVYCCLHSTYTPPVAVYILSEATYIYHMMYLVFDC